MSAAPARTETHRSFDPTEPICSIQIFGTKKSFDTKKAQRYFKERRIKFQFIDLKEKEMSKGELQSVMRAGGGHRRRGRPGREGS